MFLDLQNLFSDKQTIAAAAGTVVSTNSLDTWVKQTPVSGGPLLHDIARGNVPELLAQITESVTSAGAATVDIQFVQSANADLSTPTVLLSTGAIAKSPKQSEAAYLINLEARVKSVLKHLGLEKASSL